jgi:hypothetical protein
MAVGLSVNEFDAISTIRVFASSSCIHPTVLFFRTILFKKSALSLP